MGTALAGRMVWILKNSHPTHVYTANIMGLSWFTFLPSLQMIAVTELFVALTAYGLTQVRMATTCFTLGMSAVILRRALVSGRQSQIHHSDQGIQYAATAYFRSV